METAIRIGSRFVHLIWNSGSYDMVAFKEQAHYGCTAGVQLGPVLREALQQSVPVLIDIPIDYSQNFKLMQDVHQDFIH